MKTRDLTMFALASGLAIGLVAEVGAQKGGGKPPPVVPKDKIAYMRIVSNLTQLFTMRSDGTQQIQITSAGAWYKAVYDPTWTGNGQILFGRTTNGNGEICRINADGTGFVSLATVPDYSSPPLQGTHARYLSISPDGSLVAFTGVSVSTHYAAFVMRADGLGVPLAVSGMRAVNDILATSNWSPDLDPVTPGYQGKLLVEHTVPTPELCAVTIMDDGFGNPVSVGLEATVMLGNHHASWSPDGGRLAVIDSGRTLMAIDVPYINGQPAFPMNPASRYVVATTPSGAAWFDGLQWKPDGSSLVFGHYNGSASYYDVYKVDVPSVAGGVPGTFIRLTSNRAYEGRASWSLPIF